MTDSDINWLSGVLGLAPHSLVRTLNDAERAEWDFYRVSARHPVAAWRNAEALWRDRLSTTVVSTIVGVNRRKLADVVAGRTHKPVLTLPAAKPLALSLGLEGGPFAFLHGLPPHPR